jgi:hypothetical protein
MAYTGSGVVSSGFPQTADPFTFTYYLTGAFADEAAVRAAEGKAVSLDTAAASSVKLAADAEPIFGRIYVAEDRKVLGFKTASVQRRFKEKLPATVGHGIAVGDSVVGAGNGLVRLAAAGAETTSAGNIVVETGTDYVVVEQL